MSNDVQKLKQTIVILKKENSDFQRYNGHLRLAISQVSESNEKLLYSLHEKYKYFGNLEHQSKSVEAEVQNRLWNIESFDFATKSFEKTSNPTFISPSAYPDHINQLDASNSKQELTNNHTIINVHDNAAVKNSIADKASSNSAQIEVSHDSINRSLSKSNIADIRENQINSVNSKEDGSVKNHLVAPYASDHSDHKNPSSKVNSESVPNYSSLDSSTKPSHGSSLSKNIESNSRYSQKSIKSLVMQSLSAEGLDSIEKLKQKQSLLIETNQKLKAEIEVLLSKIGDTDLFIQFQNESKSYLEALKELHKIERDINQTFNTKQSSEEQKSNSNSHSQALNIIDDHQNQVSSVFLTDVESKPKSENKSEHNSEQNLDHQNDNTHFTQELKKVDCSCQTTNNIRSRFIVKYFSKGTHQNYLEKQNNKIATRRALITELASEIEKYKVDKEEISAKKIEIPTNLTQIQNISVVDIHNQYNYEDKETETDEHIDFDRIVSQIEENKKYTKEYLIYMNEKFNIQSIYDQKVIELKLAQSLTDHKTANYRSLLRNLKTTDPDSYAKFIGTVGMSSKDEKKRQRYLHQINKFTEKIKKANIVTKEIEIKEKQVKLRIEMLERELVVYKNPKDHMKSVLTDLCQEIALDQEKIRDHMREVAFVKLESDFVDRIKTRILKKNSKITELSLKINEMAIKLKKIKGRCRYSLRSGQKYAITSPSELDNLQDIFDKTESEVNSFEEKIDIFSKKSISCFKQLVAHKLSVPAAPKSCQTVQSHLKNVL